jgi:hypothetical protein
MKSPLPCSIFLLAALCLGDSYKQGTLLEYADHQGRSYFCLEVRQPDRILIAKAKRAKSAPLTGKPVQVKYDDESVWLRPAHGRTLHLRQDYQTRAFLPGSPCEQVVEAAWNRLTAPQKKLIVRSTQN